MKFIKAKEGCPASADSHRQLGGAAQAKAHNLSQIRNAPRQASVFSTERPIMRRTNRLRQGLTAHGRSGTPRAFAKKKADPVAQDRLGR